MSLSASAIVANPVPFRTLPEAPAKEMRRSLLLECKSLPRSGLHYMKSVFTRALGDRFSFCEWYHEPDCCRKMPCTVGACSGVGTGGCGRGQGVKLTKSHDFDLRDPLSALGDGMMRIILVRDPLYILTSWYTLDCLSCYAGLLAEHGIDVRRIWYLHERKPLADAFEIIDGCFIDSSASELEHWLSGKSAYIAAFLEKWALPLAERPVAGMELVSYGEIDVFVNRVLAACGLASSAIRHEATFRPRISPYSAPSRKVGDYLLRHARRFERYASRVRGADRRMMIPALHGALNEAGETSP